MDCFVCEQGNFEPVNTTVERKVRGKTYAVPVDAEVCSNCGYTLIEGSDVAESMRTAADLYRRDHGLLTSSAIRKLRERMGVSQIELARELGVGVASVKRWEWGRVQTRAHDKALRALIDEMEDVPCRRYVFARGYELVLDDAGLGGLAGLAHGPPCFIEPIATT